MMNISGKEAEMANCCDMQEGDRFVCETCGLELKVAKPCNCKPGEPEACNVPLQCCGKSMVKR
jgi:hypothetical protein